MSNKDIADAMKRFFQNLPVLDSEDPPEDEEGNGYGFREGPQRCTENGLIVQEFFIDHELKKLIFHDDGELLDHWEDKFSCKISFSYDPYQSYDRTQLCKPMSDLLTITGSRACLE
ncbi:uncharacterized protein LOC129230482 [Uloborus diversus]|uniref:uncharacterized protein LOC129230482 n=1 Tax=Uloborus diversus TaxID=327109 RepID=UPI002409C75C|nr:uncharacterized protein LOC129230482 [Uloborus diversus]